MTPKKNAVASLAGDTTAKTSRRQAAVTTRMPARAKVVEAIDRDLVAAIDGRLAAVVVFALDDNHDVHTRLRLYLTLTAAQRAVQDAHGRGQHAAAVLVQLHTVGVPGGAS